MQPRRRSEQDTEDAVGETARSLAALSPMEMLRLKAIARLRARGLPSDTSWSDLLNEAIARALDGTRHCPEGIGIVTFLAGIMRSIASEHWRRLRREAGILDLSDDDGADAVDPAPDPERNLATLQALAALDQLFAGDPAASQILAGLAGGLSPKEIRETYGLSEVDYDSTRKRMRRLLLRHGLAWSVR